MQPYSGEKHLSNWTSQLKTQWQIYFALTVVLYGISLYHSFQNNPELRSGLEPYFQVLDLISFIIALALAIAVFLMKRKYFTSKFTWSVTNRIMKSNPEQDDDEILKQILKELKSKMTLVWLFGFLLVMDGILFYWLTYSSRNMHLYFVVGAYSLLLNYPRKDLVIDLPWEIREIKKEYMKT